MKIVGPKRYSPGTCLKIKTPLIVSYLKLLCCQETVFGHLGVNKFLTLALIIIKIVLSIVFV